MTEEPKMIMRTKICKQTGVAMQLVAPSRLEEINGELYAVPDHNSTRWEVIE